MKHSEIFLDRAAAGSALAGILVAKKLLDPVVLALPRGGVPVATEIADRLKAPLDIVLVRKIGVPFQPELAVAAVVDGSHPEVVVNQDVAQGADIPPGYVDVLIRRELEEIERRRRVFLQGRAQVPLEGRTIVLVDDGIATGASIRAALKALRRRKPRRLILAVPVAPAEILDVLKSEVDEIVCLSTPEPFIAIGVHYRDFHQLSDDEVISHLAVRSAESERQRSAAK